MGKKTCQLLKNKTNMNASKRTGKAQHQKMKLLQPLCTCLQQIIRILNKSSGCMVISTGTFVFKIHTRLLNIEDKNGKYHETQIFINNTSGDKCLTMHAFNSTCVILAKGVLWKEWAEVEFPVLLIHVQNQSSNEQCPSTSFLEAINNQKLKSGSKTKSKSNINNQTSENSPTDDSNELAEEDNNDGLLDSIENLWDEKSTTEVLPGTFRQKFSERKQVFGRHKVSYK